MQNKKRNVVRWLKRSAWIAAALALVALITLAFLPKPVPVDIVVARRASLRVTVDEDGRTRVVDHFEIGAPLTGNLARIELHVGDRVEAGDVIARLVPLARPLMDASARAEAEARVAASNAAWRQAQSSIGRARAALEYAQAQSSRQRGLVQRGSLAPDVVERADLELRSRREELVSAELGARVAAHQLEMARAALGRLDDDDDEANEQLEITAPIDGVVLRVLHESSGVVQPGTPLLAIGDPAHLEVAVDVLTSDAVRIEPGQRVAIERWGGDEALEAHVRLVEPSAFTRTSALGVEEQRVNVVIDLDSPRTEWERLGDGYRVEARIQIWEAEDVLTVASSAVFRDGERWAVYRVVDGVARRTHVEVGQRTGLAVQLVSGLRAGDRVVAHPSDRITDGVAVEPR
jgi:HlyD family secretion protein